MPVTNNLWFFLNSTVSYKPVVKLKNCKDYNSTTYLWESAEFKKHHKMFVIGTFCGM